MTALVPVRDIAKYGVITDVDPYDLPIGSWSFGVNARFRNGKITRGPVFRNVRELTNSTPRFIVGYSPTSGVEQTYIGHQSGRVFLTTPASETDYSIAAFVDASSEATWTAAHLADLIYINRTDRVPWYLPSGASQLAVLPAWTSTYRAGLIRASNSALLAFNITQGATNYPTGVMTSSFALAGTAPASWDYTTPGTNATFNILAEMEGSIVDAQTLHDDVYIYGANETWRMFFTNDANVWDYKRIFDNRGAINANCSVEVLGKHYVFAQDDIWVHDGNTPVSIADGRVREFIFGAIDLSKASRCFVTHNPHLKDIHFCFLSGDQRTKFLPYNSSGFDGCNRQAVYNYAFNTWSFDDLPYVYSASRCNVDATLTYASVATTYSTQGGSYQDQAGNAKKPLCYVGDANSTYGLSASLYAFDLYGTGSIAPYSVDTNATGYFYLERDGIDLDEVAADLPGYKTINSLYPEGRLDTDAAAVSFTIGGADYFTTSPTLSDAQTWNGSDLYKLDFNMAGRYLTMQITFNDYKSLTLTGFDLDLAVLGER